MSSRATLKDSSVTEQMLVPNLRRRKSQRGLSMVYEAAGGGAVSTGVVAQYRTSSSQAITIAADCEHVVRVALPVAVVAATGVTTSPWRWVSQANVDADVVVEITADFTEWRRVTAAVLVNGRDALATSLVRVTGVDLIGRVKVRVGDVVTVELRATNPRDVAATLTLTAASIVVAAL